MKLKKFLNIDIEPAPPELELSVEMRCRDIMQSTDYDNIKRYCTHLIRHQLDQDVFLANLIAKRPKPKKPINPIKKFFRIL